MGNCAASLSRRGRKSKAWSQSEPSERSIKALENLKQRSCSRSSRRFGSRTRKTHSSISRVSRDGGEEEGSLVQVKLVLAKREVTWLLSEMLGENREELGESGRVGWTPSLESITEAD